MECAGIQFVYFLWLIASFCVVFLNLNTIKFLAPGDWDSEKLVFAVPITFLAVFIVDWMTGKILCNELFRKSAKETKEFIRHEASYLEGNPLHETRIQTYERLFSIFEKKFLGVSVIEKMFRRFLLVYFFIELKLSIYFLISKPDFVWWVSSAPLIATFLNIGTGLMRGYLITYPNECKTLARQYKAYMKEHN